MGAFRRKASLHGAWSHPQAGLISGGFTLVELLVSVTVMLVVLVMASFSYVKIAKSHKVQSEAPEAKMAAAIALERIRYDIEMAGFGLPVSNSVSPAVGEAVSDSSYNPDPEDLNDVQVSRAFVLAENKGLNGSDVLAVKALYHDPVTASPRWSILYHDGANWRFRALPGWLELENGDRFIVLNPDMMLLGDFTGKWLFTVNGNYYSDASAVGGQIQPTPLTSDIFLVLGIGKEDLQVPYRRVDYHLEAGTQPKRCAPGTGILYRSVIDKDGKRVSQSVMYCVRDFQVAFGKDTNSDSNVDSWNSDTSSASEIREQVRLVRVFILAHEGGRDDDFSFSGSLTLGDADTGTLSTFTPSGDALHYRWKVLTITEEPRNLRR
jgi:prepilin-type N-terminal cleavage/methylation domain-containing protein